MEMKGRKVERQEGGRGRRQKKKDEHILTWKSNEWTKISWEAETRGGLGEGTGNIARRVGVCPLLVAAEWCREHQVPLQAALFSATC